MSSHVVESTSELSAFMKAGVMAGSERDAGFCSGADEDDMSGLHSPSASEDSVEVQVTPISLRNKRKLAEPRRIQEQKSAPLKKRRYEQMEENTITDEESRIARSPSPFRPWSTSSKSSDTKISVAQISRGTLSPSLTSGIGEQAEESRRQVGRRVEGEESRIEEGGFPPRIRDLDQSSRARSPTQSRLQASLAQRRDADVGGEKSEAGLPADAADLGLISARSKAGAMSPSTPSAPSREEMPLLPLAHPRLQEEPLSLVLRGELPRVPSHPGVNPSAGYERPMPYPMPYPMTDPLGSSHQHENHHQGTATAAAAAAAAQSSPTRQQHQQLHHHHHQQGSQQRNYKNMTRERRIEANARERTRVHTISAAFDTLRRAIPAYSHNQKLSKLSVLRIACSYIMTLGKIVNTPEGEATNGPSLGACVDLVSRTIQTEGKLRKRKED